MAEAMRLARDRVAIQQVALAGIERSRRTRRPAIEHAHGNGAGCRETVTASWAVANNAAIAHAKVNIAPAFAETLARAYRDSINGWFDPINGRRARSRRSFITFCLSPLVA